MEQQGDPARPVQSLLVYTGQPLIDVGVATIIAFAGCSTPAEVTRADLDKIVEYIATSYVREPLKSFLASIYPNAAYVNPTMGAEKRAETMMRFLRGYAAPASDPSRRCAFCGRPACDVVFRQHIPLTAGEGVINFGPGGRPGLQICGGCLLASQAFPLGCGVKVAGRALLVHSDDPTLMLEFARLFLQENQRHLTVADASGDVKMSFPRTIVISHLTKIEQRRTFEARPSSITAYHLTNYGTNADVAILHLPSQTISFLKTVGSDHYRDVWPAIVARAWVQQKQPKESSRGSGKTMKGEKPPAAAVPQEGAATPIGTRRNRLYEDLFDASVAPARAARFIRRYFLRGAKGAASLLEGDTDRLDRLRLVSWPLTELFLRKVIQMEPYRVGAIRAVGDRLAAAIEANDDQRLLKDLYAAKRYPFLRTTLLKANNAQVKAGAAPLISFDDFITIFEDNEDAASLNWTLARDLMYIRVLDVLYNTGWIGRNAGIAQTVLDQLAEADSQEEQEGLATA